MRINELETPSYIIDEKKLRENLEILHSVEQRTGARILLAQKCFSAFYEYPLIAKYISGTTASGLYEARLGSEEMGKENHVFSPAYREKDMEEIARICDHVIFNSKSQLKKFLPVLERVNGQDFEAKSADDYGNIDSHSHVVSAGIRVNPECSTQGDHAIYDPCALGSRMGVRACDFDLEILSMVDGIHFHTLCEQNSDDLETTLQAVEEKFGKYLHQVKWLNMGGGHHITRDDYDLEKLCQLITHMKETYDLEIYLEPGEAVALNAGYLATTVLDIVENDITTLILDASAACHMPDVLEMPYQPPLKDAWRADEFEEKFPERKVENRLAEAGDQETEKSVKNLSKEVLQESAKEEDGLGRKEGEGAVLEKKYYKYRLSSNTCLAGDVIGDYVFDHQIKVGDRLCFEDMAIYSMVKNNTFNGIPLPSIAAMDEAGDVRIIKEFGYEDFKGRLS